jgi:hypothetical protein
MDARVQMDVVTHTGCCFFVISTWVENRLCRLIVREHFGPIVEVRRLVSPYLLRLKRRRRLTPLTANTITFTFLGYLRKWQMFSSGRDVCPLA